MKKLKNTLYSMNNRKKKTGPLPCRAKKAKWLWFLTSEQNNLDNVQKQSDTTKIT